MFAKKIILSLVIGTITYIVTGIFQGADIPTLTSTNYLLSLVIIIAAVLLAMVIPFDKEAGSSQGGARELGTVKWFNMKKGYGFITRDQGDDIFVHYRNIEGKGRRVINEGQRVEFIVITGDKGPQADEVKTV